MAPKKELFKPLTKAEEAVMMALWQQEGKAFIKDIIAAMPKPQPHYNTVSTLLKILAEKSFVQSQLMGNAHYYEPLINKAEYSKRSVKQLLKGYFNNSFAGMVSYFAGEDEIGIDELEAILKTLRKNAAK